MTVIRFSNAADGTHIGDVRVTGEGLDADLPAQSIADSWTARGKTPAAFAERYADWSNGYVSSREAEDSDHPG